jgi:3-dehydroquinate dehydratase-2
VRVAVLNGVNLDVLHRRNPEQYGGLSLNQLETQIYEWARELELLADCRQTNSEAEYIGWCHDALDWAGGVIANPGAWTHYSYALRDALAILTVPIVEIHMSNNHAREEFRQHSVISPIAKGYIAGFGIDSYLLGLRAAVSAAGAAAGA